MLGPACSAYMLDSLLLVHLHRKQSSEHFLPSEYAQDNWGDSKYPWSQLPQ
jgi:hypothetical protein